MKAQNRNQKGRVFVGMSGGVDSSVSAALLVRAGYEVVGVFIKAWEPPGFACSWREDRRDAMRVAARLQIPLVTLDLGAAYKQAVVDYMLAEYKAGRTPNPDIECNRAIKFGLLYEWARQRGADFIATGHYAREANGRLLAAHDKNKDQTYFLWTLTPDKLRHILFPIGEYTKPQVRQLAKKFGLPNAAKKDSQGLCFIGQIDVKDFLRAELGEGAHLYTIGEKVDGQFVLAKDLATNTLTLGPERPAAPAVVKLTGANWLAAPVAGTTYRARIRHRGALYPARVAGDEVHFIERPEAVAAGQSVVVYEGEHVLGGGIIL